MLSTTGGKLKVSPRKILEKYNKIKKQNKSKNVVIGFGITEKTIQSLRTVSYTHLTLPTKRIDQLYLHTLSLEIILKKNL